jgi:hypothetical protein
MEPDAWWDRRMGMRMTAGRTTLVLATVGLALAVAGCGGGTTDAGGGTGDPTGAATDPLDDTATEDGMTEVPDPLEPPASGAAVPDMPSAPAGADLTVVLTSGGVEQPPITLTCDWAAGTAGGSHPEADQACTDLLAAVRGGNPFLPVPPDAMCTQVFGGEAAARVGGTIVGEDGASVDVTADYSLTNGCEIDRWETMGAVLAPFRDGATS